MQCCSVFQNIEKSSWQIGLKCATIKIPSKAGGEKLDLENYIAWPAEYGLSNERIGEDGLGSRTLRKK